MEWTGLNELREKYLSFFESKGHLRLPSFPLVPKDDKSLLLINSGMAPMKKYFTGEVTPPRKRVTTCQKCIRTPDIERVGITARHGTYFEMLGNFSFGDYFKHEATAWSWEFCTKVLELPEDKIWVSIYEKDDEAFDIWTKEVGVSPKRIVRLGKEDNFWEHGSGPCGPCSELYFDRGEKYGCGKPTCGVGCDCDRYVEFWNNVFTQFNNDGNGNYTPLEHPNIDTGMGLERLACIMQGVDNLFLVDTVQNIMKHASEISGVKYGESEKTDVSLRVVTDHIRSVTFMIGDGVMPSNEGRGYVLRRLLRRAARHGRILGITEPFLYKIVDTVIKENPAYPELEEKREIITKVVKIEEENFSKTLSLGFELLNKVIDDSDFQTISGDDAFKLNDTFGLPLDLIKEIAKERNFKVDEEGFRQLLAEQKKRAKEARSKADSEAWLSDNADLSDVAKTEFLGYTQLSNDAKVLAIIKNGERVKFAGADDKVVIVLDKTSFYAESGGQTGDIGIIKIANGEIEVEDTVKNNNGIFMHYCVVKSGVISEGDTVTAEVDKETRKSTMRNHTAAHILQASLRKLLGNHVEQAGQLVSADRMRFDFTHFSALTDKELYQIENMVNDVIFDAIDVDCREMPIEEAKKLGAMALFGEKYGDVVRVVSIGDYSREFCGGTHVDNTSKIGMFKIISESSVAAGVRRIEAVTGRGVLNALNHVSDMVKQGAAILKVNNINDFVDVCEHIANDIKEKEHSINKLNNSIAAFKLDSLFANSELKKDVRIISAAFTSTNSEMLKNMCDRVLSSADKCVAVLFGIDGEKATIAVACGKEAVKKGAHAGKIVKEVAAIVGGKGGGKPERAMAGVKDLTKIDEALMQVENIILPMIKE